MVLRSLPSGGPFTMTCRKFSDRLARSIGSRLVVPASGSTGRAGSTASCGRIDQGTVHGCATRTCCGSGERPFSSFFLFGQFNVAGARHTCDTSAVPWSQSACSFNRWPSGLASAVGSGRSNQ